MMRRRDPSLPISSTSSSTSLPLPSTTAFDATTAPKNTEINGDDSTNGRSSAVKKNRISSCFYRYFWFIGSAFTLIGNIVLLSYNTNLSFFSSTPTTTSTTTTTTTTLLSVPIPKKYQKLNQSSQKVEIHANTLIQDDHEHNKQISIQQEGINNDNNSIGQQKNPRRNKNRQPTVRKRPEHDQNFPLDPSVSFCVLIKDDNDILNEWLAYHYHTFHLRHVIVAVDPSSTTSPESILQTWKEEFQLTFEIWGDDDFMPEYFLQGFYDDVPRMIKVEDKNATKWQEDEDVGKLSEEHLRQDYIQINNHRYRQAKFLQRCCKRLQDSNKTWVTHIDTDEYIVINPTLRRQQQQQLEQGQEEDQLDSVSSSLTALIPDSLTANSLWKILETLYVTYPASINWPCLSMPRVLYGSVIDDNGNLANTSNTGRYFLETLRWKYHASYGDGDLNKQPKAIMDVSGFPPFNITRKAFSIHRPSLRLCRGRGDVNLLDGRRYPLTVNHYVGSMERYLAREDARRTQKAYREKAMVNDGKDDDWIDGWWTNFILQQGVEKVIKVFGAEFIAAISPNHTENVKPLALGRKLPIENDSFSACLLVKDDNDILNEWIAYHYHVLKLRTLIIASDPSSITSPSVVLNRWKSLMDIQEWTDESYMPEFFLQKQYHLVPNMIGNMTNSTNSQFHESNNNDDHLEEERVRNDLIKINNHRYRQATFFGSCIKHLKELGKTWMIHIDTDEYVVLHHQVRKQDHWRKMDIHPKIGPSSVLEFLKNASSLYAKGIAYPCVSMPRLLFGSKEDDGEGDEEEDEEEDGMNAGIFNGNKDIPSLFNRTKFETLRWKYHSDYDNDIELNGKPKVILDLTGLPPKTNFLKDQGVFSIHRPGLFICRRYQDVLFNVSHKFPITVNHYIGSWERYNSRNDARRNFQTYNKKANVTAGKDDKWIDGWVASFVEEMGLHQATQLLAEYVNDDVDDNLVSHLDITNGDNYPGEMNSVDRGFRRKPKPAALYNYDTSRRMEFSACLLVKDDNDILIEWIAYHYHVLGLRYVIVAVDAKSKTSPTPILDKWRRLGMTIEEWQDEAFMPDMYFQKAYHLQPRLVKIRKNKHKWLEGFEDLETEKEYVHTIQDHRFRQIVFVSACTKRLREQNRTWMVHIDTDEYIVINPKLRRLQRFNGTIDVPSRVESSIIPRLLNRMVVSSWDTLNYPCISLPRLLYGSIEDNSDVNIKGTIPSKYNASRFETIRWKHHANFGDGDLNKQPKVIIDVSSIPSDDKMLTEGRVFSIHRPSQYLCRNQGQMDFDGIEYYPFSVNHYLGTFERFGARDDLRRNRKLYEQKSNVNGGKDDDWIDGWLGSFIEDVGEERAMELLDSYLTKN